MSLLRQAWEGRAVGTVEALPAPGRSIADVPAGYGQPGHGSWGAGMTWQPGGYNGYGVPDNDEAMRLSAVFACLRLLSEAISTLPLDTFTRAPGGARTEVAKPRYLEFRPGGLSRITYLSQVLLSLLTNGNAFVATPRDEMGVPLGLVPLDPTLVKVTRGPRNTPIYEIAGDQYGPLDVMHITGMTLPGSLTGVSPLRAAREVIASGRKAQEYGISFFDNSAVPPAVIEMPGDLAGDPASAMDRARRVAQTWNETNGGTSNAGKVGVLIGGASLKSVAISPEDAEWLESKRFGVSEIARFYGVPPHLIADASNSTSWGSGLAEQNTAFGQFSVRPWAERVEEAHNRLLWTHGSGAVFMKLNLDAVLRASLKDRYESYRTGIEAGFLLTNEARRWEDLPPLPDTGTDPDQPAPPTGGAQ